MVQASDRAAETQYSYDRLMVALEASQGKLDLLIAVCNDRNLQAKIIQRYEQELRAQGIHPFRLLIQRREPSLRSSLESLVEEQPALQSGHPAVVTVQGIEDLLQPMTDVPRSQQELFLGYLQWTREALRQFQFPVVVWVTDQILVQLGEKSPDFWSWRGGVFWFGLRPEEVQPPSPVPASRISAVSEPTEFNGLQTLLHQIEALEQQPDKDPAQLASLFEQLGELYAQRFESGKDRQFAIQAFKRAIDLQTELGHQAELASSWKQLGDLYLELKDDVKQAADAYDEALQIYRSVGDAFCTSAALRLGEANTLQAIGDVLQFLDQRSEALQRYDEALQIYRSVGDRLGEANTLQAIGDVLQFLDQRSEALQRYDEALQIYRSVGARLGEANTLLGLGSLQDDPEQAMIYFLDAQAIFEQIGDKYSQGRNLLMFIVKAQWQQGDSEGIMHSLETAAVIGDEIGFEPFRQVAEQIWAELQAPDA